MKKLNINTLVLHRVVREEILNFEDIAENVFDKILSNYSKNKNFLTIENAFSKNNLENNVFS